LDQFDFKQSRHIGTYLAGCSGKCLVKDASLPHLTQIAFSF
jgi:hypothetical protein